MSSLPHTIQSRFKRALTVINSIPQDEIGLQLVPADRLKFYGLYKQATQGECNTPKPLSKKIVDYAKWKAWYRVRHLTSLEAQAMYINALVELLAEFIHRYPNNAYIAFAKEALYNLESQDSAGSDEDEYYVDTWDDPLEPKAKHHYHHIAYDTHLVTSPTVSYFTQASLISQTPSLHTSSSTSITHNDVKTPPISSPQLQYQLHSSDRHYHSDRQKSPPMTGRSPIIQTLSLHPDQEEKLEKLQTKVAALTEQMDRLRQELRPSPRRSSLGWFLKTVLKHALANTLLATLWICLLWYRQSPIALALVDYSTPLVKRWFLKRIMFWNMTV